MFDHAKLVAGTLLDGLHAFLELDDLGFEDLVALQQAFVLAILVGDLLLEFAHLGEAAITNPQAILKTAKQQEQEGEQPVGTSHGW